MTSSVSAASTLPPSRSHAVDAFDTQESYFRPPPDDETLRILFDERDPEVLQA